MLHHKRVHHLLPDIPQCVAEFRYVYVTYTLTDKHGGDHQLSLDRVARKYIIESLRREHSTCYQRRPLVSLYDIYYGISQRVADGRGEESAT